jgi:hypothetical protein
MNNVMHLMHLGSDTIPRELEPRRRYVPASEDGLKESPKHVRQK